MATSSRFGRYLGSTKNLVGSAAGLAGVGLHLGGALGSWWWPAAVGVMYAAGALLAPPAADDRELETLRAEMTKLRRRVADDARRLPTGTAPRVSTIAEILRALLADRAALDEHPSARAEARNAVSIELPELIDHHLSLPTWQDREIAGHYLLAQLDVVIAHLLRLAGEMGVDLDRRLGGDPDELGPV